MFHNICFGLMRMTGHQASVWWTSRAQGSGKSWFTRKYLC